ncbi:MAG: SidA/IucD/PvdA family monooxygenase [Thiotrichaceae bacterium]|nr:SidA/IucD/PvdA family monooxygenase [Thiotrichaceae bacterium]
MNDKIYDYVGVGIGPFNLSLACMLDPINDLEGIFLDKGERFNWHPGLLFDDARLQTPFMSDLVTLADPTSPFSFLNYIKEQGRLYSFYIRENFFLLRNEYNQYCQWAASKLSNLVYNTEVSNIEYDQAQLCYVIQSTSTTTGTAKIYRAKKLILGSGPVSHVPLCCESLAGDVIHASKYLFEKSNMQAKKSITVVGSGQSAAEIVLDLLQDIHQYDYELSWITRSPRYFPLEYTKLTLEMTSPEYVDYFYDLPVKKREKLNRDHVHLAKGINGDTINEISDTLYEKRIIKDIKVNLFTNSALETVTFNKKNGQYEMEFLQWEEKKRYAHDTEGLILSTGYAFHIPDYLEGITSRIRWNEQGQYDTHRYYTIDHDNKYIFVQNAEHHTHGFVTPDLGMCCYRNSHIIRQMLGYEYYPIETKIAFQAFAVSSGREIKTEETVS